MLEEKIEYNQRRPIKISMCSIEEYPIHWHQNDLELIVVLEGSVKLIQGYRTLLLKKDDIFIVNEWELHGIYSTGGENKLLLVQLDLQFFQKYDKDLYYFFLMADTYYKGNKYRAIEIKLKENIFEVVNAVLSKEERNEDKINKLTLSLLLFLKDNFQYFVLSEYGYFINKYDLKENPAQAKRVSDVYEFMCINYRDRMTLDECAQKMNLSMHYLSHIVKDAIGMNFQELLNFVRMEASEKLLLETNMKISEIAIECGFSATRYYVNSFTKWYNTSPQAYRAIHKEKMLAKKVQTCYSKEEILEAVGSGADAVTPSQYGLYNQHIEVIGIDVESNRKGLKPLKKLFLLLSDKDLNFVGSGGTYDFSLFGDHCNFMYEISENLIDENNKINRMMQHISENRINSLLFEKSGDINKREAIINRIEDYSVFIKARNPFKIYLNNGDGRLVEKQNAAAPAKRAKEINAGGTFSQDKNFIYDSIYYTPLLINDITSGKYSTLYRFSDEAKGIGVLQGEKSLITGSGIVKPAYNAVLLFSLLGDEVIFRGTDTIITRKNNSLQLLFYDYSHNINKYESLKSFGTPEHVLSSFKGAQANREYVVEIKNLKGKYKLTHLEITKNTCIFNKWMDLLKPRYFSYQEEGILKRSLLPEIDFETVEINDTFDVAVSIPHFGAKIILIEKINE